MQHYKFELGVIVVDQPTGFSGITTSVCEDISGYIQYLVEPTNFSGKSDRLESRWLPEGRLVRAPI